VGSGQRLRVQERAPNIGAAAIYVNFYLVILIDSHVDVYSNCIWLVINTSSSVQWGFWWTITHTKVLPNGNLLLYTVPLSISFYGLPNPYPNLILAGPGFINVVILPPFAGSGNMHGSQYVTVSGLGAYFNGWGSGMQQIGG
jgi:hypothetical protein